VLRQITITEDSVKFHDMFDQAMHHAMINQSNVLRNSMQNAIYYQMMTDNYQPRYRGPCYSQPESSAATASRAVASATSSIGTHPPTLSTVQPGIGFYPMLPFFQPLMFEPVGSPI